MTWPELPTSEQDEVQAVLDSMTFELVRQQNRQPFL